MSATDFPIGSIVSAGILAGAYPKSHKWDEVRQLWHAARVTEGWPEPLCKKVKREGSVNDDSTQFNRRPVNCPACLSKLASMRAHGVDVKIQVRQ